MDEHLGKNVQEAKVLFRCAGQIYYVTGEISVDLKQRFQQDMRDAMRAHDKQRVNVVCLLLAAFEHAQEAMGKQAFDSFDPDETNIQPDCHQTLNEQAIQDIIRNEVQRRREAADLFRAGGQKKRAESEETEIAILEDYLTKM